MKDMLSNVYGDKRYIGKSHNILLLLLFVAAVTLSACQVQQTKEESTQSEFVADTAEKAEDLSETETLELASTEASSSALATEASTEYTEPETSSIALPPDSKEEFVKVVDYIPTMQVELRYNTENNFVGKRIYDFSDAYLRYGTVEKLMKVQEELNAQGLSIKIWDAFRPVEAQFKLWEAYPVSGFVANPHNGYSSHSRGNTVDITLSDIHGNELEMPTPFDEFSSKADRDYSDCTDTARHNAELLENLMVKYGFKAYHKEWWHFSDTDKYPVGEGFYPEKE